MNPGYLHPSRRGSGSNPSRQSSDSIVGGRINLRALIRSTQDCFDLGRNSTVNSFEDLIGIGLQEAYEFPDSRRALCWLHVPERKHRADSTTPTGDEFDETENDVLKPFDGPCALLRREIQLWDELLLVAELGRIIVVLSKVDRVFWMCLLSVFLIIGRELLAVILVVVLPVAIR